MSLFRCEDCSHYQSHKKNPTRCNYCFTFHYQNPFRCAGCINVRNQVKIQGDGLRSTTASEVYDALLLKAFGILHVAKDEKAGVAFVHFKNLEQSSEFYNLHLSIGVNILGYVCVVKPTRRFTIPTSYLPPRSSDELFRDFNELNHKMRAKLYKTEVKIREYMQKHEKLSQELAASKVRQQERMSSFN